MQARHQLWSAALVLTAGLTFLGLDAKTATPQEGAHAISLDDFHVVELAEIVSEDAGNARREGVGPADGEAGC